MSASSLQVLRLSLVAVWLFTAAFSLIELRSQSAALLLQAGVGDAGWRDALVIAGALLDLVLGLALWLRPGRPSYVAAGAGLLLMTLVASLMLPALWLHPLGPLLKNLPIAAVLWVLWRETPA
ncbi:DoxX-like family protein [Paucibacter sp. APW11]|uniref:DoxX-like family protein n=1 Tax=Roseateles aquae TaxID=3077235 RepID=A0ABU3PE42_9BURK|nr:DoxX-like family protein [Paucibacter sp. APW11]MDT9000828.1 DoxX-like family protein [Paucibacter sp. APW11]